MKFENIIRNLKKAGYKVEPMEFSFQNCLGVNGTALVDTCNTEVIPTTAKYQEVISQIEGNKSHIQTISTNRGCTQKRLTEYLKL